MELRILMILEMPGGHTGFVNRLPALLQIFTIMGYSRKELTSALQELIRKVDRIEKMLADHNLPGNQDAELITVLEASQYINLSASTIYT